MSTVEVMAGVTAIAVPTPFAIGHVNAFLIEDDPLTLVDSGPNWGPSLTALEAGLAARGHVVEDLELLLVTHQHADHLGLCGRIAERSGATVAALDPLGAFLERFEDALREDDDFALALMLRHGAHADAARLVRSFLTVNRKWGGAVAVGRRLVDGDELRLRDRTLRVAHRPGHSPTDTIFIDDERRTAFVGDHLLSRISSNPLLALPRPLERTPAEGAADRPRALPAYLESLARTRTDGLERLFGGHGADVTDVDGLIEERLGHHEERLADIAAILGDHGPASAHAIARRIWGRRALTQMMLTLSEVLGHLDVLAARGLVEERANDTTTTFALRGRN
jgi:glyoxylase-like metal-dependent hydrolase (beta-lactamase superfamily II)